MNKLTFWQWCEKDDLLEGEEPNPDEYKRWFLGSFFEHSNVHDGDCRGIPMGCGLCQIEELLSEYREYYFKEN